jgi:hypothetical protein
LETERQHVPPQSVTAIRARGRASLRVALLSCGSFASRRHPPRSSMASGCMLPPRGFKSTPRSSNGGTSLFTGSVTFLRLNAAAEYHPNTARTRRAHALPRFLHPHSATHPLRSTIPGPCLPGSRCVTALTMCLDALLPRRTPWCPFNQVRSRGEGPSELDLTEIVTLSRCDIPSCDWHPSRVQSDIKPTALAPPRDQPSAGTAF